MTEIKIPITDNVCLSISSSSKDDFWYEEAWQLFEAKEYDFEIIGDDSGVCVEGWTISKPEAIFRINSKHGNRGVIKTGTYVGTLQFDVINLTDHSKYPVRIEVRSHKIDYKEHYRKMLEDISRHYTDLVMQQASPITQMFEVDHNASSETLYQKFSFLKGILDSDIFEEAVHKVISNPVRKWEEETCERRIESVRRLSRSAIRQIVTNSDRIPLSGIAGLSSLPRTVSVAHKVDTVDTHENQFIKYALTSFYSFCSILVTKERASDFLKEEAEVLCGRLAEYLNNGFFKQVSRPTRLNIGSPVLQRKEGYREILQAWLMFDLAAKIVWEGGNNVYDAGKKNIAALYEYWLFFKLRDVVCEAFGIALEDENKEKERLVTIDEDNICLNLKQGKFVVISGTYESPKGRKLNVALSYNKTFSHSEENKSGSWTVQMRPDYTLSIWPGDIDSAKAEEENTIVHLHFDAKYRLDKVLLKDVSKVDDTTLDQEKEQSEMDIYKRGDLLKMHAYKDAIRRTAGAYILYPGGNDGGSCSENITEGFHEILPGLGAFCVAPGRYEDDQTKRLCDFIREVVAHFLDRTTEREKIAISTKMIQNARKPQSFTHSFPEPSPVLDSSELCGLFPDTTLVLVASIESEIHLQWVRENNKFYIPLGSMDEVTFDSSIVNARYLLLYDLEHMKVVESPLFKINGSPKICSSRSLLTGRVPAPISEQLYMVFDIGKDIPTELSCHEWDIAGLKLTSREPKLAYYVNLFSDPLSQTAPWK